MAYQYRKDHDLDATESGLFSHYRILLARLTKKDIDRPRFRTAVNLWRKTQRIDIEAETKAIAEAAKKKPLGPDEKPEALITIRDRVARGRFGKLPAEERAFWKQEALTEHELAMNLWKTNMNAPAPTDPAARQR